MTINQPVTNTPVADNKNKWIWIGLGAALLFCCCAVLVAVLIFRQVGKKFGEGVKTDPTSAAQTARTIVDYDLPPHYREQMAMDMMVYTVAFIGPDSNKVKGPTIMLAHFTPVGGNQEQMKQQIRQSLEQQAGNTGTTMKLVEVKKMKIRGEETDVAIYEGTDDSGLAMRQWLTSFPGKTGIVMMMIMGEISEWDQPLVDDFIASIR